MKHEILYVQVCCIYWISKIGGEEVTTQCSTSNLGTLKYLFQDQLLSQTAGDSSDNLAILGGESYLLKVFDPMDNHRLFGEKRFTGEDISQIHQ